jgi:murein DD-endopeptidase MepM/ murein hydrolase activator NlpD
LNRSRRHNGAAKRGRAVVPSGTKKALPQVYLKGGDRILPEIYMTDHGTHKGSMTRWIVSTMLAGLVGIGAIGTVLYASIKNQNDPHSGGLVSELQMLSEKAMTPFKPLLVKRHKGPHIAGNKSDRLFVTSKGLATRDIFHDTYARKRGQRDYVDIKQYTRLVSALATARPDDISSIPPFDPFKLYSRSGRISSARGGRNGSTDATTTTHQLPLSISGSDDRYRLSDAAAYRFVKIAAEDFFADEIAKKQGTGESAPLLRTAAPADKTEDRQSNTTILAKNIVTTVQHEPEAAEYHEIRIKPGDTFAGLLRRTGAENWQAHEIMTAMRPIYSANSIKAGQKVRYVALPKPGDGSRTEPVEIALYEGRKHLVTVARNEAGDYKASTKEGQTKFYGRKSTVPRRASLYQSFYHSALLQKLPADKIMKLLQIHAYDTDFKLLAQPGDSFKAFYDTKADAGALENPPNELLYTSVSINGKNREFFRFRLPDGTVDYYDRNGNSAKKFLMRKPVRGRRVRLSSGFGWRIHPILKRRKMHTGTDWAAPTGTPILAAGDGTIEKAGTKGTYGNYVRIRHANGYKTAYAHMHHIAKGIKKGIKVRQGQVIGYIGTSGRSSGPHLHFEVLINNKFVNAMTIPVPRGLKLKGHQLAKFIKERDRIVELMSRDPVLTRVASAQ